MTIRLLLKLQFYYFYSGMSMCDFHQSKPFKHKGYSITQLIDWNIIYKYRSRSHSLITIELD